MNAETTERPTGVADIGSERVTFGAWEPDPDALPIYGGVMDLRGPFAGVLTLHPQTGGWRRRRFTTWRENGRECGRWTWERRAA